MSDQSIASAARLLAAALIAQREADQQEQGEPRTDATVSDLQTKLCSVYIAELHEVSHGSHSLDR